MKRKVILLMIVLVSVSFNYSVYSADNEACMECHSDRSLTTVRAKREVSLYVDINVYNNSVHSEQDCTNCHEDADVDDFPHNEKLDPVNCGNCHDKEKSKFDSGVHGRSLKENHLYAPTCTECHGKHNIFSPEDQKSPSYRMNVPYLCGKCHREGAPVARIYKISERNIVENYSQSIHGEGLFKKGLSVTATCVDCHGRAFY